MKSRYVDLKDKAIVADFIDAVVEFLPEREQAGYLELLAELQEEKSVISETTIKKVKELAALTWPARRALKHYLYGAGAEEEWTKLLEAVRPTTAFLLARVRKNSGVRTVDEALQSSEAALALHDEEEAEMQLIRPEVQIEIWQEQDQELLRPLIREAHIEFEAIQKRLKVLREQTEHAGAQTERLTEKLIDLEDRIYFAGEAISLEVLDEEIKFAIEDVMLPATEEATN